MDAVLFDMDGVLVDSVPHKYDMWRRVLQDDLELDVAMTDLVGLNRADKYEYLQRHTAIRIGEEEFAERMSEGIDEVYAERTDLLDCFEQVTEYLRSEGVKVGIVTAGSDRHLREVVNRFGIGDAVDATVSADTIDGPSKPEPDLYLHATTALSVDPENCVAVEDSTNGVRAAKQAGAYCIGYRPPENLDQDLGEADETVADPDALETRLLSLAPTA